MEDFKFDMPKREARVTNLIKVQELEVSTLTPEYKLKLTKKGRIKVKFKQIRFAVNCKLTVELKSGIRMHEIWQSGGVNYRVVAVDTVAQDALLISSGIVSHFSYPGIFLFIGFQCVEEGGTI